MEASFSIIPSLRIAVKVKLYLALLGFLFISPFTHLLTIKAEESQSVEKPSHGGIIIYSTDEYEKLKKREKKRKAPPIKKELPFSHAHSLYKDDIKYHKDFTHFAYANPDAHKGGHVVLSAYGSFDSLNPFVLKGSAASQLGLVFQTLTIGSQDEEFTHYGLVAEGMHVSKDKSWIEYKLNPKAAFQDGSKISPEDVIWSFNTLKTEGHPFYRNYFFSVEKVEKTGDLNVKFTFSEKDNPELPLITGQLPILQKSFWHGRKFNSDLLRFPIGSGPYKVTEVNPGTSITLERDPEWWGKDLPVNKGKFNFDKITIEYYKDVDVMFQAFLGGEYDFRQENTARNWATGYKGEAIDKSYIVRKRFKHNDPVGLQGFVFNTRRELFKDVLVRQAISLMFDFEWTNKNIFYDQYERSKSFYNNTDLEAPFHPTEESLIQLQDYKDNLPEALFSKPFLVSETNGDGNIRPQMRKALALFKEAGWDLKQGKLLNIKTLEPFTFELVESSRTLDRIVQPFLRNLEKIGIYATVRYVDSAQYENRIEGFDFDMTMLVLSQSLNPGNEQRGYFGSYNAHKNGTRNYAGLENKIVDELIEKIVKSNSRDILRKNVQALDRILLWEHIVIPLYYSGHHRLAWWDRFGYPDISPKYGIGFPDTWWIDPQKDDKLKEELDR